MVELGLETPSRSGSRILAFKDIYLEQCCLIELPKMMEMFLVFVLSYTVTTGHI